MKALIVGGNGQVGQAVAKLWSLKGNESSTFGSKDDRSKFEERAKQCGVIFLTIQTRDTGETALGYALDSVRADRRLVTCEKGLLGYRFQEIRSHLKHIRYTASVGGGSRMMSLFSRRRLGLKKMTGVVNGTLNFLFSECARGQDPYLALADAKRLGLCEPGNNSLADVVNGELRDILLKVSILFNCSGISDEALSAKEFASVAVGEDEVLGQLARKTVRFVVSISKIPNEAMSDSLYGCLYVRKGEWHIQAGLARMSSLPFNPFPERQQNALVIEEGGGLTQVTGIGAGPIPTAETMIMDVLDDV